MDEIEYCEYIFDESDICKKPDRIEIIWNSCTFSINHTYVPFSVWLIRKKDYNFSFIKVYDIR